MSEALVRYTLEGVMFVPRPCSTPQCNNTALTGRDACSTHCPDVEAFTAEIADILRTRKHLADMDISGITLSGIDVEGVRLSGCNLGRVRFRKVTLRKAVIHLLFMDGAEISGCDFSSGTIHNSVFAGSVITDTLFEDSDILQCSFVGARLQQTRFDHSHLYASRFTAAAFAGVGMKDCNLIRVRFDREVSGVEFKSSNTMEAIFGEEMR